uniref:hypothetical protein n=1 Tax=Herbidospora sakaeratensis TaxID=564415 RepID=UPI00078372B8|nr:hypothetical protein [Herbidospora sakaeratensis]
MSFNFSQPAAGSDWKAKDFVGHLIVFFPRRLEENIATQFGTSDALRVDLVVLTAQGGPQVEENVLLFQKPLIGSLSGNIGKDPVLARLAQGTAKANQSAPYILQPFSQEDAAYAGQYMQSVGGNPFQSAPQFGSAAGNPAPQVPHVPLPTAAPAPAPAYAPPAQQQPAPAYQAAQPNPGYQAAPPAQPQPPAGGMVTMPNGQVVSAETAAAAANLGMTFGTPPPQA